MGIDPGYSGALCSIDIDKGILALRVFDMPVFYKNNHRKSLDIPTLKTILMEEHPDHIVIEQVASRFGDGPVGAFSFGTGYGILLGLLAGLGISHTTVPPTVWKKELSVPANKDEARARASQLLPIYASHWLLKKHDGRAEAAMMALFGIRKGL